MSRNAYVLLLLTMLMWGGNAVAGKMAVGHISPMVLTTFRWLGAVALMLAIGIPQLRRDWHVVRPRLLYLFLLGAAGFTLFNAAMYTALTFTTVINVSIEQAGMPMFIFIANFVLYRIGVSAGQVIGFSLSMVGVALTATHGNLLTLSEQQINSGDLLMLAAVLLYAGYTIALRYKPAIHWKSLMSVMAVAAALTSLPFMAWEVATDAAIWPDMRGWGIVLYTAIFPSVVSQLFYVRAVDLIGANRAGLFINLVPIFGTILSIAILGEDLEMYHIAALVMVLGGIWLAENSGRKRAARD
ncbi:DMT family transporter [Aerobium aerolatum]|uniref:Permease of the drug/metabolite transporter (DMT) superfamily n=1 Tax=Aquamicrobium aerolatum DSM 21857 TaxID=1121003 RepID=A0A1I3SIU4_9HYPH|nr:DMT family transporter [Aquamicrobium aerolatum]SFJ57561.1 Permease of the drug/metabolite transporter (DMT) superfamily [Aquamicrobium aerolatum DSM 21857]